MQRKQGIKNFAPKTKFDSITTFNLQHIPAHGNFCGPGYCGGKYTYQQDLCDFSVDSLDEIDAICKRHDFAYSNGRFREGDLSFEAELSSVPGWKSFVFKNAIQAKRRIYEIMYISGYNNSTRPMGSKQKGLVPGLTAVKAVTPVQDYQFYQILYGLDDGFVNLSADLANPSLGPGDGGTNPFINYQANQGKYHSPGYVGVVPTDAALISVFPSHVHQINVQHRLTFSTVLSTTNAFGTDVLFSYGWLNVITSAFVPIFQKTERLNAFNIIGTEKLYYCEVEHAFSSNNPFPNGPGYFVANVSVSGYSTLGYGVVELIQNPSELRVNVSNYTFTPAPTTEHTTN